MANSVYKINKGINKSIEFKGLKAQYIWYLGGGVIGLLIMFAAMFIIGIHMYICLGLILIVGAMMVVKIYGLSRKYGEYGLMKTLARKQVPGVVKCNSRNLFNSN